jgi:hypothetical protein
LVSETLKKQIDLFLLASGFSFISRITILGREKFHLIFLVMVSQLSQNTYMLKRLEDQRKNLIEDQMMTKVRQFRKSLNIGGV